MDDEVLVATDGMVATVTLNRPAALNAMTGAMQRRYCATLRELDADPSVRAVIVTGAGRGFCAGAELGQLDDASTLAESFGSVDEVPLDTPMHLSTPVLAAVNGPCAGMGTSYALMADLRWAAEGARIGTTFARLGLVAEWGIAHTLSRAVGSGAAADLLLSGRFVDASEALALGLVTRVLPAEELLPAAQEWARDVAERTSPRSHAAIKRQLRAVAAGEDPAEGFARSVQDMLGSFRWPDLARGIRAVRTHEQPGFPPYPPPPAP